MQEDRRRACLPLPYCLDRCSLPSAVVLSSRYNEGSSTTLEVGVKRLIVFSAVLLICITAFAADKNVSQTRVLTGQVTDHHEAPLVNAIVYLKNTKTLTVRTYITGVKGDYRFPELSPDVDYQVYAEFNGVKSDTKTLSSFDSRLQPTINLKIAANK